MASSPTSEKAVSYTLLGLTVVTGFVDAVSFLSLGRVFTANMTGNIVLLAFATAHVPGLFIARSVTALLAFLAGAVLGGRMMSRASADSQVRFAAQAFLLEVAFLLQATGLPTAGVTTFNALRHSGASPGSLVEAKPAAKG